GLREQLRRVATFGPAAIPPWVVLKSVVQRDRLRDAMLAMHETSEGRAILAPARIARFVQVPDRNYDLIRKMAAAAADVELAAAPAAMAT
ncbi:MAG: PhnD/SsuA/transferrin family substrate-binding protein, partial [Burkholderiales bacterium]